MEKDTVLLGVETYNALRDFKKHIERGNTLKINYRSYNSYGDHAFITTDKAVKSIVEERNLTVANLEEKITELNQQINVLENPTPKEISINDLKKMSYWEFCKWRKSIIQYKNVYSE